MLHASHRIVNSTVCAVVGSFPAEKWANNGAARYLCPERLAPKGRPVIHKLILRHRLRSAASRSRRFMERCNYLGEQIESRTPCSAALQQGPSSAQIKELLKARRARANSFGAHLFANPAWDIVLLAYVALLDEELLFVSTLLRTSLIPATTTLRWVRTLEQDGWLELTADQMDDARSVLKLSAAGKAGLEGYLAAVWPLFPL